MKRANRLRGLASLHEQLRSDDFDIREHGLFQLAMLLRHNRHAAVAQAQPNFVSDSLPRDLLRLRLSADEKRQAIGQLTQVISDFPQSRATAIWALGELEAEFALEPAVTSIAKIGGQLQNEAAFQVCVALAGWLSANEATFAVVELSDMRALLRGWAASSDARLAKRAVELLAQLPSS